jgi:hypothetical protein
MSRIEIWAIGELAKDMRQAVTCGFACANAAGQPASGAKTAIFQEFK